MRPVFQTTLAGLRARRLRLVATALAVVLGVGFISGTLIFSDTAKAAIYDGIAKFGRNVDVVAQAKDASATAGKAQNAALLEQLRGVEGVRFASGRMSRTLPVLGKDRKMLGSSYRPGTVAFFGDVPQLHPFDVTEGRLPAAAGEAALESATADRGDLAVGDTVTVLDARQGQHQLSVVGIVDCGGSKAVADDALVLLTRADMATIAETTGYYSLVAAAERGIDPEDLASRVRAQLPATIAVTTGGDFRFGLVNGAVGQFGVFLNVLLIFAGIALVVAVFVIYNTFTILVAQRMRETALLRCVGADRRQIFTSVVTESIIIGLLGSGLGYLLGIGVAAGLGLLFDTAGLVAGHPMVLTAAPVAVSLLAGTLATSASAVIPAVHATRVSPLAALTAVGMPGAGTGRQRGLRAGIALAIAVGGTIVTIAGSQPRGTSMLPMVLVMAGGVINFLAVLVAAPLFIGPLIAAIGWLPGRLFGTPAKLAASHARRTPGRAAATTAALMVGVGLMSAASVTTATVRTTADGQITANYPVDYVVESAITRTAASEKHLTAGLPIELAQRLTEDRRFSVVARVRIESTTLLAEGD
ncbi:MAG: ABC transporter permease, partial [Micromonosporaceae bacterium]|nr:ABC transporter permease [Micromonosporaceae bacterium]